MQEVLADGSAWVALALAPLLVLLFAFVVFCLVDLARARSVRYLPKIVWALVILFVSAPVGGIVYLLLGRDRDDRGRAAAERDTADVVRR